MQICQTTKRHISSFTILYCSNMQQFLYCTVTAEKAVKHIAASKIRKWPHREAFSALSRCCMNLCFKRQVQYIENIQHVKCYWALILGFSFR